MSPADILISLVFLVYSLLISGAFLLIPYVGKRKRLIQLILLLAAFALGTTGVFWAIFGGGSEKSWELRVGVSLVFIICAILGYLFELRVVEVCSVAIGQGGAGENASVDGNHSEAEGGSGGLGDIGPGGRGGSASVKGNNSFARGGDGGNSGQRDGRGGRRTKSSAEHANTETAMWSYGCGGHGANLPEYDRRVKVLKEIRREYQTAFPGDVIFIEA